MKSAEVPVARQRVECLGWPRHQALQVRRHREALRCADAGLGAAVVHIRFIDRKIERYEHWATQLRDSAEFYEQLLRYATTKDPVARAWLAEALSRHDYVRASRWWMGYLL